jgi:hypothetical protein
MFMSTIRPEPESARCLKNGRISGQPEPEPDIRYILTLNTVKVQKKDTQSTKLWSKGSTGMCGCYKEREVPPFEAHLTRSDTDPAAQVRQTRNEEFSAVKYLPSS